MGDVRFEKPYLRVAQAADRVTAIQALSNQEVLMALAGASRQRDPLVANVLATEALNRMQRVETVTENLAEGVLGIDDSGEINFANPAALEQLGYEEDELVGMKYHPNIHFYEDGTPLPIERCAILQSLRTRETISVRESGQAFRRKDGTLFPIETTSAPVERDEEVVGAVATFRDISAEREAHIALTRLAAIVEHSSDAILVVLPDGTISHANPALERLFGIRAEAILDRPLWDFPADEHEETRERLQRALQGEVVESESTTRRPDGSTIHTHTKTFPVCDDQDRVIAVAGIIRDITDRKRAEQEQARRRILAEHRLSVLLPSLAWGAAVGALLLLLTLSAAVVYPVNVHDHILLVGALIAMLAGAAASTGVYVRQARRHLLAEAQ